MSDSIGKIAYSCPFVPAELIAALGFLPNRITPSCDFPKQHFTASEGVCPYVADFLNTLLNVPNLSAAIFTTLCDQMRRAADIFILNSSVPTFVLNVPKTRQGSIGEKIYRSELYRLCDFLQRLSGKTFSQSLLIEAMLKRNTVPKQTDANKIPLAIVGGPLRQQDLKILSYIEQLGAGIVFNATENGERGICRSFDLQKVKINPMNELADAYLNGIYDVSQRPNDEFYNWFKSNLIAKSVKAIILWRYLWCDLWHGETQKLKSLGLPVLELDCADNTNQSYERIKTRLGAFMEMLK